MVCAQAPPTPGQAGRDSCHLRSENANRPVTLSRVRCALGSLLRIGRKGRDPMDAPETHGDNALDPRSTNSV